MKGKTMAVEIFHDMIGKVYRNIEVDRNRMVFYGNDNSVVSFYHEQDCCEDVFIEDIVGDVHALLHSPLIMAEDVSAEDTNPDCGEKWTFYKFATTKGYVTVRWYGMSNGYYSVTVCRDVQEKHVG
jgi:hypothetical protein